MVALLLAITLLEQSETPLPAALETAVAQEIDQSSGGRLSWTNTPGEFPDLVLVRVHGACRIPARPDPSACGPLGWVDRVDGKFLSVIHVDCSRIGEELARIVTPPHCIVSGDPRCRAANEMYSRAIARVVRHELHHIRLNTGKHEKTGENKPALRPEALVEQAFSPVPLTY